MTLEWQRHHPDATGSHSKCKRYSTCRATDGTWELWRVAPGGPWFAQIAQGLPTEGMAQGVAEQDAAP